MTDREKIDLIKKLVTDYIIHISVEMDYEVDTSRHREMEAQTETLYKLMKEIDLIDKGETE